jgi:serine/threonine protein kinase
VRDDDPGQADTVDGAGTAPTLAPAGGAAAAAPAGGPRYRVVGEIAKGGMGRIVHAYDGELGRHVAIKEVLQPHPSLLARFRREALITARLQHPSIVPIYEIGERSGEPYYVMRFLRGQPLEAAIKGRTTVRERLELLSHISAAADAIAYAHSESIIHRDLKPLNVLVGEFGETMVIDWGLAKDLSAASGPDVEVGPYRSATAAPGETVKGSIVGTPAYMPPEQAAGEAVDQRADVYSLGAMMHHVLAGEPPFGGRTAEETLIKVLSEPPRALPDDLPDDLRAIVRKAMAHDPGGRYPSAREMADDLRRFTSGRLVGAHQYSVGQLAGRWIRRAWLPIVLGVLLLAALVTSYVWISSERDQRSRIEAHDRDLELENQRLWQERGTSR